MIIFSVLFVHDCRLPRVRKKRIVFLVFVCSFPIDLRSPTRFSFVLLSGPCALCLSFCHVDFLIVDILTAVKTTYNHTKHTHNIAAPSESGRCEALLLYWCLAWYDVRYEPVPPVVCFQFSIQNKKNLTANGGCCCCCCTINPLSLMKFPVAGWQSVPQRCYDMILCDVPCAAVWCCCAWDAWGISSCVMRSSTYTLCCRFFKLGTKIFRNLEFVSPLGPRGYRRNPVQQSS